MIRAITDIIDDIKEKIEGFPPLDKKAIASIMKEFEEVEHLVLTDGAAIDLNRVVALVRKQIQVAVDSDEEKIQKEIIAQLKLLGIVATAFKQHFESQRSK